MKFSGDSEILHKQVRDTTQISSCFSDFRVVSWTISCRISEFPLHFIFFLCTYIQYIVRTPPPPAWQRVEQMSWTDFPFSLRPLTSRTSSPGWRQPLRSAAPPFTTRPATRGASRRVKICYTEQVLALDRTEHDCQIRQWVTPYISSESICVKLTIFNVLIIFQAHLTSKNREKSKFSWFLQKIASGNRMMCKFFSANFFLPSVGGV